MLKTYHFYHILIIFCNQWKKIPIELIIDHQSSTLVYYRYKTIDLIEKCVERKLDVINAG